MVNPEMVGTVSFFDGFVLLLRANLFKNQADLYWRVIYDPLRFARNFLGERPMAR